MRAATINHDDKEARSLKASAFRKLGYAQMNINWRNWYLMAARELEGTLNLAILQKGVSLIFASPDLVAAFPARAWVEGFTTRLKAEQTLDVKMTVSFRFPDVNESLGLEMRRGVAQFHPQMPEPTDAVITIADPGRELAFTTLHKDGREETLWRYQFNPVGAGTEVSESYRFLWCPIANRIAELPIPRDKQLRRGIQETLTRIKTAAEHRPR